MSIQIDLTWWELTCDERLCLMRSSFTLLWENYLWDYYEALRVWFGAQFQRVGVIILHRHWSSVSVIWGFESTMFETVVAGWVTFILVSSHPIPLLTSGPLIALWASYDHHNIFFLIALLTFYTVIGALWCIYALFGSLMSHGLIDSYFSLFFCCPTIIFHHTLLFISFVFVIAFFSMPWVMIFHISMHRERSCSLPFLSHGHWLKDP